MPMTTTDIKRIMLIDDEISFTRLLRANLQQTGQYVVEVANNPAQALAAAEAFLPQLILLDVMMPEIDGGELAARLKASPRLANAPIVFLTAAVSKEEVHARNGHIGGQPFVAKPVDLPELISVLQKHLGP
jgi:CheY-like chemotaxis protein